MSTEKNRLNETVLLGTQSILVYEHSMLIHAGMYPYLDQKRILCTCNIRYCLGMLTIIVYFKALWLLDLR